MITLADILQDTNYRLTQFSRDKIGELEEKITIRESKSKVEPYVECIVRKKEIKLTPEEVIRQLYVMVLTQDLDYPISRMELEYPVTFGREKNEQIL